MEILKLKAINFANRVMNRIQVENQEEFRNILIDEYEKDFENTIFVEEPEPIFVNDEEPLRVEDESLFIDDNVISADDIISSMGH